MKLLFFTSLLVASLCGASSVYACSCAYAGEFSVVASDRPLVITARIKSYGRSLPGESEYYYSMQLEDIQTLKGGYSKAGLKILGDNSLLCRASINKSRFRVGKRFVFALQQPERAEVELSVCGEYWAAVDGTQIVGN